MSLHRTGIVGRSAGAKLSQLEKRVFRASPERGRIADQKDGELKIAARGSRCNFSAKSV